MEHYLRKIQHMGHHVDSRKIKKYLIIAGVVVLFGIITFVVLVIMAFNWLFSQGDNIKQAGTDAAQTVQSASTPLNLESYVSEAGQVDTTRLEDTFTALPSQLQDVWLGQFKAQIEDLSNQAGVPVDTIKQLNDLYNSLSQLQG